MIFATIFISLLIGFALALILDFFNTVWLKEYNSILEMRLLEKEKDATITEERLFALYKREAELLKETQNG